MMMIPPPKKYVLVGKAEHILKDVSNFLASEYFV